MNRRKALVVDDSKSARFAMRKFLESHGYEVDTAESAEDAFRRIGEQRPDVIFLDHVMPGTDGFEALGQLKRDSHTALLPVVLCSSNEGEDFVRQARAQGAVDVLLKPPSREQIAAVLALMPALMPTSAPPPTPPLHKVQAIREPEIAIEQAVMRTLRDALPAPSLVAVRPLPLAQPLPDEVAAARAEMERRLRKITQDLYVQLAETRAQIAHLDGAFQGQSEAALQALIAEVVEDRVQAQVNARIDALSRHLDQQIDALRGDVDARLQAQHQRIDEIGRTLHAAVTEEAHAVSERVVMNAAARISDQIAESILKVLKPTVGRSAAG